MWQYFKLFIDLVSKQMFPLDNISMLLFLDTVKCFDCKSTTCMKYIPEIWKSGYRMFHAEILYYMGGPKNVGEGHIELSSTKINFIRYSFKYVEENASWGY